MEQLLHLPSLSEDLVTEILEHLPVKSLLRFKCVSKPWCNLIESPRFVDGHLQKRRKNGNMMVMLRKWKARNLRKEQDDRLVLTFHDVDSPQLEVVLPNLQTPIFTEHKRFRYRDITTHLLGPCEGLLCVVRKFNAFVCNPALRQFKLVPPCPYLKESNYEGGPSHLVSSDHWGFGNIGNNGFNVVQLDCISRVYRDESDDRVNRLLLIQPYLYDSVTESWRQINDSGILLSFDGKAGSELSFNGTCCWHIFRKGFHHHPGPGIILSYEIRTEVFTQFGYPDLLRERQLECPDELLSESEEGFISLMALNECLTMVWFPHSYSLPLEVWVMKEYGIEESWSKQFVVDRQTMTWPFMFWKNDESMLLEGYIDGELISYDLRTEETEKVQIHGVDVIFSAAIYTDSLISLK